MNLIYIDWTVYGKSDIIHALKQLNHTVFLHPQPSKLDFEFNYIKDLADTISDKKIDFILSWNYFNSVSEACQSKGIPYISWIYDNPHTGIYGISAINSCNYIFTFNSHTYHDLANKGIQTVYYAPLAANAERLGRLYLSHAERKQFSKDIAFAGSLYTYESNESMYQAVSEKLSACGKRKALGFIDALIDSQLKIYGHNFLEDAIPDTILADLDEAYPYDKDSPLLHFASPSYIYASHMLSRHVTTIERTKVLAELSNHFPVHIFTYHPEKAVGKCTLSGTIEPYEAAPKMYKSSKINLNITIRSIETGIPLRAFEVMGSGGFLLSNYQEDYLLHFDPDKDFVYYDSEEDLIEKCAFYLAHDTIRKKIAANGYERIKQDHTYVKRLAEMIQIATGK